MRVNGLFSGHNYAVCTDNIIKETRIFNSCYHDIDNKDMIEISSMIIELFKMISGYDIYVNNEDITKLLGNIKNKYEEIEIPESFNAYMRLWFKDIMKSIKEKYFDIYFDAIEITYADNAKYKYPVSYQLNTLKAFYEVIHKIQTEYQESEKY